MPVAGTEPNPQRILIVRAEGFKGRRGLGEIVEFLPRALIIFELREHQEVQWSLIREKAELRNRQIPTTDRTDDGAKHRGNSREVAHENVDGLSWHVG
jgi:hypothetical protein